jgi:hypothetical protein
MTAVFFNWAETTKEISVLNEYINNSDLNCLLWWYDLLKTQISFKND